MINESTRRACGSKLSSPQQLPRLPRRDPAHASQTERGEALSAASAGVQGQAATLAASHGIRERPQAQLPGRPAGREPKAQAKPVGDDGSLKQSNFKSKTVSAHPVDKLVTMPFTRIRRHKLQLLAEISDTDTPSSRVLHTILRNLGLAINSNCMTPNAGDTFDQVPYFELVTKLEAQQQSMLEQHEQWEKMVSENQAIADDLHQHIDFRHNALTKLRRILILYN